MRIAGEWNCGTFNPSWAGLLIGVVVPVVVIFLVIGVLFLSVCFIVLVCDTDLLLSIITGLGTCGIGGWLLTKSCSVFLRCVVLDLMGKNSDSMAGLRVFGVVIPMIGMFPNWLLISCAVSIVVFALDILSELVEL